MHHFKDHPGSILIVDNPTFNKTNAIHQHLRSNTILGLNSSFHTHGTQPNRGIFQRQMQNLILKQII